MTHRQARVQLAQASGWRKSTRSDGENNCVELAGASGWVGVRDTKLGAASPVLAVPAAHFAALVTELDTLG